MVVRLSIGLFICLSLYLQHKVWFSDVGYLASRQLAAQVLEQQRRTEILRQRNRLLAAEVLALNDGLEAVESRARSNLGMIRQGETFYLVSESNLSPEEIGSHG